jgi:glycosyltransferase involved in cell wall biosynthesis
MKTEPVAFTVVIPTYQRRASLHRVLLGLAVQEWPTDRLEVLVVSDGGDDGSVEMARSFPLRFPLRVLEQANQGPGVARNLGAVEARHPFVLFLDDDVVPRPRLVAEHARGHGTAANRVVIGPMLEPPVRLLPWVRWEARMLGQQYRAMEAGEFRPTPWQFYTGNASVRAEVLRRAGGFDPTWKRAEDIELGFRLRDLGCEFVFNRLAAGLHYATRSYRSWLDAAYQYGRNDILFGKAHERVAGEFGNRHPITRVLVRWGVRHRRGAVRLGAGAGAAIRAAEGLRLWRLASQLCGADFNLAYWLGVSDQLGSAKAALELADLGSRPGLLSRARSSLPIGPGPGRQ